ncbi:MAG: FAD-dependent oxidoreductase [Candidatus Brocadiia bacterium]
MGKRLVLVGGGHAHMTVLRRLDEFAARGHRVTLISKEEYHYYSGMGPGLLGGIYAPQQARFHIRLMAQDRGAEFIEDVVEQVDADRRLLSLRSGGEVQYDVVSFNTGSHVPVDELAPDADANVLTVKPIVNLLRAREEILQLAAAGGRCRILIVGGGPAGVEVAGNLCRLLPADGDDCTVTLVAGRRLLHGMSGKVRRLARTSLLLRGVRVLEGEFVERLSDGRAALRSGSGVPYDLALVATGVRPSPVFSGSGLPTGPDGGLLVNDRLQSVARPEIFGGGDCVSLEGQRLKRVGVHAVRQNPILFANLMAALEGGPMMRFRPDENYLLILNMGDGRGLATKKGLVWGGWPAFMLKDFIDRRFVAEFQVSGELSEPCGPLGQSG